MQEPISYQLKIIIIIRA